MKQFSKRNVFLFAIFALIGTAATCQNAPATGGKPGTIQPANVAIAAKLLHLSDAEKIMGEPAKLTGNTFVKKSDTMEYRCDYTALKEDTITGNTGKLYFLYEIYSHTTAAAGAYAAIYEANRKHEGAKIVSGLGDEAYYHSDGNGFYFVLVRKKEKLVRMKVNKITSRTSEAAFNEVTRRIVDKL